MANETPKPSYKTCINFPAATLNIIEQARANYGLQSFTATVLFIINDWAKGKGI